MCIKTVAGKTDKHLFYCCAAAVGGKLHTNQSRALDALDNYVNAKVVRSSGQIALLVGISALLDRNHNEVWAKVAEWKNTHRCSESESEVE